MERTDLTQYDIKPEAMINYLRYNGPHFNKKLLDFATSNMTKEGNIKITPFTKEDIDAKLKATNTQLKNNQLYDYVFVANMCKADYLGQSVPNNDTNLCLYIKNVIDDPDGYDGLPFNRWYADMCRKGIVINWEEMI